MIQLEYDVVGDERSVAQKNNVKLRLRFSLHLLKRCIFLQFAMPNYIKYQNQTRVWSDCAEKFETNFAKLGRVPNLCALTGVLGLCAQRKFK